MIQRLVIIGMILSFLVILVLPLLQLFTQAFYNKDGVFIGLANFSKYFTTPTLVQSLQNTVWISGATTIISVSIAFVYAYAIARTNVLKACISVCSVITIVCTNDDARYSTYIFIW